MSLPNNMVSYKLSKFSSFIQSTVQQQSQSPSPSPTDFFNIFLLQLNEWLAAISNFFTSIYAKLNLDAIFHWLIVAAPFIVGGLLLVCFLWCCLPIIISCLVWVLLTLWNLVMIPVMMVWSLIVLLLTMVWSACRGVFNIFCCCGRRSVKMMKAPGRGGRVNIPRPWFEGNARMYFRDLRGSRSLV